MAKSVYAAIYDENGNFIVAKKNNSAWFRMGGSDNSPTRTPILNNSGKPISQPLRGGGLYCFPGGGKLSQEPKNNNLEKASLTNLKMPKNFHDIDNMVLAPATSTSNRPSGNTHGLPRLLSTNLDVLGAVREFKEETGFDISTCIDANGTYGHSTNEYCCVFIRIKDNHQSIDNIVSEISTNLRYAKDFANAISQPHQSATPSTSSNHSVTPNTNCPLSNELDSCEKVKLEDITIETVSGKVCMKIRNEILFEEGSEDTGWFYESLKWFKDNFNNIKMDYKQRS